MSKIYGEVAGGFGQPKTIILTDETGNELGVGVVTDSVKVFDATPNDVRINKNFVSDEGALTGENTITYRTEQGTRLVMPEEDFVLPLSDHNKYNYTELQCMFAPFNTSLKDSVAVDKIVLQNGVFATNSTEKISSVTKDDIAKSINFNITNTSDNIYCIHYFTYCQEEML